MNPLAGIALDCQSAGVPDDHFQEPVACEYDAAVGEMFDPAVVEPAVAVLAELAGGSGGRALEFGVGTGRIALPLRERGVRVHGIDLSTAMVSRLRAKPGGDEIDVTIGDFATTSVAGAGEFTLAYLVFNTVMNLTTQDEQVSCFCNASAHLTPGGYFVVEVMVPDLQRLPLGETVRPFNVSPTAFGFDEYDTVRQGLVSHHYRRAGAGDAWESQAIPFRYVWPGELDLMARIAGMSLRQRWSDWAKAPFTAESRSHVSVWEKTSR